MENKKEDRKRRVIGKPFTSGDARINRAGTPKTFYQLRKLAQQIGQERCRDSNGNTLTVAEAVLRKLVMSNESQSLRIFLEYGYGKPVDKIETTGLENNKTLVLHFGHEKEKVERAERLLGNGNCE